jgi:transcriptional regulator with XRE-family HTH domain
MSLSPPQIKAAELLAKGHSQQEVGDAVGVSRRTILRWLKQEDFKNLSFGLLGRSVQPPQLVQRPSERRRQSGSLTAQDLVQGALLAVQDILSDQEARNCDRLKAAALVGDWAGLSQQKSKMVEAEAIKILIETGWLPDEILEVIVDGGEEYNSKMKAAFHKNENKKSLLQESEEGNFDVNEFDDGFDDDDE